MLWVTRHAFQHQREHDNRALNAAGQWPAKTHHATRTRDALYWATMGGAKAMRLEHKIGSITPGKQADLTMFDTRGMNLFSILPGGDPVHAIVMNAEAADVDSVMVAGRFLKRGGKLVFPESRMLQLRDETLESRRHLMHDAGYTYAAAPNGPMPERYIV
jgi:cytosine/adenosine deaminase-related metal-dependent hydrolase